MKYHDDGKSIDIAKFTKRYDTFEERRREYTSASDRLLDQARTDHSPLDRPLYDYIFAFRSEGAKAASLQQRQKSLLRFFNDIEVK